MADALKNWAGNITFGAKSLPKPASVEELQEVVAKATKVKAIGSGHSFSPIADSNDVMVSLSRLNRVVDIDRAAHTVTIEGGVTYAQLAPVLHAEGYALGNVASLPHITVAGAVNTATHGSGDANRNLAAAVTALKLVTADGSIESYRRGEADFDGVVVGLGALGVVSKLTLELKPSFNVRQTVFLDLPVANLLANFEAVMSRAYSVSLFTRWQGDTISQVWLKAIDDGGEAGADLFGALAATVPQHPIPLMDPANCTIQLGESGPWHERLFHFHIGYLSSTGAEVQSEYFVPRRDAVEAFRALHAVQADFAPALYASEVRSVAGDDLWLSPSYGGDMVGFHFTWRPELERTMAAVRVVEAALGRFEIRPHWAKIYTIPAPEVVARYPRMDDFKSLAARLDPQGKFGNAFVDPYLRG